MGKPPHRGGGPFEFPIPHKGAGKIKTLGDQNYLINFGI